VGTREVKGFNNTLLGELAEELKQEEQQENDVTVQQLVTSTGYSENQIRRKLAKKVKDGELIKVWGKHAETGTHGWLFRKPTDK
jgi:DeoR/GlpR family transcriptional regulator of sugar metabolism